MDDAMLTPDVGPCVRGDDLYNALMSMEGVLAVEPLDRGTVDEVRRIEDSIRTVSGGMRLENRGMDECARMDRHYVMFCGGKFPRPDEVTMEMVTDSGTVIGHDVPPSMMMSLRGRDDVVWLSETFVMYPGRVKFSDAALVMLSSRLDLPGIRDEVRMFFPSMSSAGFLLERFGRGGDTAAAIIGAGLSSCDRCGGGCRWTAPPW